MIDEAGNLLNVPGIVNHLNVAESTVRRWIKTLNAFYYCFTIKPWHKNIRKAIRKTPKLYLWDWSVISDEGARCENFVASHLHKAVHYWTDLGFGSYELFHVRDRNKRELDFLVTKDKQPWFLVEVKKSNNQSISPHLHYFSEELGIPHAFQAVFDLPFVDVDCFSYQKQVIVPVSTLLSQLV